MFARQAMPGWTAWGDESGTDSAPRGKVHRGYAGGAIEAPYLEPHDRLDTETADALADVLSEQYKAGASVRQLAETTGYSITRVRGLLEKAGTPMRPRGRQPQQEQLFA